MQEDDRKAELSDADARHQLTFLADGIRQAAKGNARAGSDRRWSLLN